MLERRSGDRTGADLPHTSGSVGQRRGGGHMGVGCGQNGSSSGIGGVDNRSRSSIAGVDNWSRSSVGVKRGLIYYPSIDTDSLITVYIYNFSI